MKPRMAEACDIGPARAIERSFFSNDWTNLEDYVRFFAKPGHFDLVVGRPGALLACARYEWRRGIELRSIAVRPGQRGRGHGRTLVDHLKAFRVPVRAWVEAGDPKVLAFYERLGFKVVCRKKRQFGGLDGIRVAWRP